MGGSRTDITEQLSNLVRKRVSRRTPYWADEVYTEPTMFTQSVPRVDFMAFYPDWKTSSGVMATSKGLFEFYEVKSCMEDFKSGHGLNFEGDRNFLVCPNELALQLHENRELPNYCTVLCPDKNFSRLLKKFETGPDHTFNTRKRSTEELLMCLLMRIRFRNEVIQDADTICGSSIVCIDEEPLRIALDYIADLIEPDVDQDIKGLYQIGADRITKDGSDTLVLYGDNALPDVIECDCTPYTRVDRQALLYLARDLEVSVMDSGAVSSVVEMIMNIAKEIRKACGE